MELVELVQSLVECALGAEDGCYAEAGPHCAYLLKWMLLKCDLLILGTGVYSPFHRHTRSVRGRGSSSGTCRCLVSPSARYTGPPPRTSP